MKTNPITSVAAPKKAPAPVPASQVDRISLDWMIQDHGNDTARCFTSDSGCDIEAKMVAKVLTEAPDAKMKRQLDSLVASKAPGKGPRWKKLYAIACKKNLIKIIVGVVIMEYGVNLFLVLLAYRTGGIAPILTEGASAADAHARMVDPVPHALILTSIVIGVAIVAMMVAMAIRVHEKYGTFDITEIRRLRG